MIGRVLCLLVIGLAQDSYPTQQLKHPTLIKNNDTTEHHDNLKTDDGHHGVVLASWRFDKYGNMFISTLMLILAVLVKLGFHKIPYISKHVPESCFLILLGVLMATLLYYGIDPDKCNSPFPHFTASLFFDILLPPIILDAAFTIYDRDFVSNFFSIITFAVVGTVFNIFTIGYSLYLLAYFDVFGSFQASVNRDCTSTSNTTTLDYGGDVIEHQLKPVEALIFSSLISAVDPVAVLAIFEEIKVNSGLYFLVFGESLLNDGVTIVLYNTMIGIEDVEVGVSEFFLSILSFFLVVFGGFLIGLMFGAIVSFLSTKTGDSRVVEPLMIFAFFYMSFVVAELVHWSGIISIIGFGLVVKRYAFTNISDKSYATVKYATKTLASTNEVIIFLFMGMVTMSETHTVHWGFIVATVIFCTIYRFIGTFFLSWFANRGRGNEINIQEQFIMAYGGLRGAVGFSLAVVIDGDKWYRGLFITTALAMVFVTVFIQGSTIKFFVKLLGIQLKNGDKEQSKLLCEIEQQVTDDLMSGIEAIVGCHGRYEAYLMFNLIDEKYIRKFLIKKDVKLKLEHMFDKAVLEDHYSNLYGPRILAKSLIDANRMTGSITKNDDPNTGPSEKNTDSKTFANAVSSRPWPASAHPNKLKKQISRDHQDMISHMETKSKNRKRIENEIFQNQIDSKEEETLTPRSRMSPAANMIYAEYGKLTQHVQKKNPINRSTKSADSEVISVGEQDEEYMASL